MVPSERIELQALFAQVVVLPDRMELSTSPFITPMLSHPLGRINR
jgi:hypothetical protein